MENKFVDFGSVHPDVKRYLDHDCYCPGEIYDFTGIWAMVYKADSVSFNKFLSKRYNSALSINIRWFNGGQ